MMAKKPRDQSSFDKGTSVEPKLTSDKIEQKRKICKCIPRSPVMSIVQTK